MTNNEEKNVKYCPYCGNAFEQGTTICSFCGKPLPTSSITTSTQEQYSQNDSANRWNNNTQYNTGNYYQAKRTDGSAIASMICGICGLVFCGI